MSMGDCSCCWETPCSCGYDYLDWPEEKINGLIAALQIAIAYKHESIYANIPKHRLSFTEEQELRARFNKFKTDHAT